MRPADPTRPMPGDRSAAEALVATVASAMDALRDLLDAETEHLAAGRIRQGLADSDRKSLIAAEYLRALEGAKTNAVALKRHVPDLLPGLKRSQEKLRDTALRNQAVIATARAVAEGLVKAVADEVGRAARPQGYAPATRAPSAPVQPGPLAFSGRF